MGSEDSSRHARSCHRITHVDSAEFAIETPHLLEQCLNGRRGGTSSYRMLLERSF
jgi:hypothetical protein